MFMRVLILCSWCRYHVINLMEVQIKYKSVGISFWLRPQLIPKIVTSGRSLELPRVYDELPHISGIAHMTPQADRAGAVNGRGHLKRRGESVKQGVARGTQVAPQSHSPPQAGQSEPRRGRIRGETIAPPLIRAWRAVCAVPVWTVRRTCCCCWLWFPCGDSASQSRSRLQWRIERWVTAGQIPDIRSACESGPRHNVSLLLGFVS